VQATSAIGVRRPREDSEAKVRGAVRYAADGPAAGVLHARLVLAQDAHARIRSIERAEALGVRGVAAVLTATDLPIVEPAGTRGGEPLAREEILFAGQPVALVVADSEAAAEDGAALVQVVTEPLPAAVELEAAMVRGAPRARFEEEAEESDLGAAHAAVGETSDELPEDVAELSENVVFSRRHRHADAGAALAASDAVVEGRFATQWLHQAYLEPQAATARPEPDGSLVVETATQGAFGLRADLARLFGLPVTAVRVVPTPLGGSFGGKLGIVEPLAAGAALALGRPVRLAFTRSEDFLATNPAPGGVIELRIGALETGELTGLEARIAFERGAVHGWGVETVATALIGGVYRWRAFDVSAYGVETNRVGFGAYRAPGAPPAAFALETLMDELAGRLGLDPLELRLANLAAEGDIRADGKPWGILGTRECLEELRGHELWRRRGELPAAEGVGLAAGVWFGASDTAGATCRLDDDGGVTLVTAFSDMTGANTTFAALTAETLGIPVEKVRVATADTAAGPRAPLSGGSKAIASVGRAVLLAAEGARRQLFEIAAAELEADPDDLEIRDGAIHPRGAPSRSVTLHTLGTRVASGDCPPVDGTGRAPYLPPSPSVTVHLAHVRVDAETGRVDVLGWAAAQDVGRALNPALCEGQLHGGIAQAIGWALYEELLADEDGQLLNGAFTGYAIPGTGDVPELDTRLVEVPAPDGPFGAKGIGEAPVVAGPAAVANAIAAATGARLRRLPMTPERVWAALHEQDGTGRGS
jgi:CO/xanthine dehydrogenase Mo-binding subunit